MIEIRVLCDSRTKALNVDADNSMSLVVNEVLVIDACSSCDRLVKNAKAIGVDLNDVKYAIITSASYHHWGGIEALKNVERVFIPYDTSRHGKALVEKLEVLGVKAVSVVNGHDEYIPKVGHVRLIRIGNKRLGELIVVLPEVNAVIIGCGLALWLFEERLIEFFKGLGVKRLIGGLGASSVSPYQVAVLQDLLRQFVDVYPLHGIGPELRENIIRRYRNVRDVGVGSIIKLEKA